MPGQGKANAHGLSQTGVKIDLCSLRAFESDRFQTLSIFFSEREEHGFDVFACPDQVGPVIGARTRVVQIRKRPDLHPIGPTGQGGHLKGTENGVVSPIGYFGDFLLRALAPALNLDVDVTRHCSYPLHSTWLNSDWMPLTFKEDREKVILCQDLIISQEFCH